jgi:hypothetical protein
MPREPSLKRELVLVENLDPCFIDATVGAEHQPRQSLASVERVETLQQRMPGDQRRGAHVLTLNQYEESPLSGELLGNSAIESVQSNQVLPIVRPAPQLDLAVRACSEPERLEDRPELAE